MVSSLFIFCHVLQTNLIFLFLNFKHFVQFSLDFLVARQPTFHFLPIFHISFLYQMADQIFIWWTFHSGTQNMCSKFFTIIFCVLKMTSLQIILRQYYITNDKSFHAKRRGMVHFAIFLFLKKKHYAHLESLCNAWINLMMKNKSLTFC